MHVDVCREIGRYVQGWGKEDHVHTSNRFFNCNVDVAAVVVVAVPKGRSQTDDSYCRLAVVAVDESEWDGCVHLPR